MQIFPSLICGDLLNLEKIIQNIESACDGFHIDVMDDHFVPNLTLGPDFVNAITNKTALPCQVHLMVDNPQNWPNRLKLKEKDTIIFHLETISNNKQLSELVGKIRGNGWHTGLAVNPATPLPLDITVLSNFDQILIMSVNPGFSGQKFIPEVVEKVKNLVNIKKHHIKDLQISIDGGINKQNIKTLADLGVNIFCVGSEVFSAQNQRKALQDLYAL